MTQLGLIGRFKHVILLKADCLIQTQNLMSLVTFKTFIIIMKYSQSPIHITAETSL